MTNKYAVLNNIPDCFALYGHVACMRHLEDNNLKVYMLIRGTS
jgi:hypothetical protein